MDSFPANSPPKILVDKIENAGGVHLRSVALGVTVDFPTNWSPQMQGYAWRLLHQEAERLGLRLAQERT